MLEEAYVRRTLLRKMINRVLRTVFPANMLEEAYVRRTLLRKMINYEDYLGIKEQINRPFRLQERHSQK